MASYSPGASQVLDLLHDRVVAFHPALVPILGGPDEALLVSQLLYWDRKGSAPARWIYKTQEEWQREVGLSPHRQRRARRRLRGLGVLEERRGGMPARLYYRLNLAVLAALAGADGAAEGALGAPSSRSTRDRDLDRDTAPEPVGGTSPQHVVDDATIQSAPTARTISGNTAQITMWDPACPGPHDLAEIWRRVCANVRLKVRPASFEAWIRPCMLRELEEQGGQTHATIEVPSDYEREWLVYRMRKLLPRALSEELGRDVEVIYCLPGEDACGTPHVPSPPEVSRASDDDGPPDVPSLPEAAQPSGGPVPVSPRPKASASPGASRQEGVSPPLEASGAQKAPPHPTNPLRRLVIVHRRPRAP